MNEDLCSDIEKIHMESCKQNHTDYCPFLYDLEYLRSGQMTEKEFRDKWRPCSE